ncbi:MAG TPA: S8 family serine peptidase, partial [Parvularculaceae bacterium]|nr:S8 family serine peptidase [Parvularculaceae bacterium]
NSGEGSSGSSSGTGDGSGSGGASRSGDNERVFVAGVDDNGDEVEQGEWLILTTTDAANALIAQGFVARRLEQLDGLGLVLVQVAAPDTQTFAAAKAIIKRTAPAASIDYNHVYFASSAPPEIHRAGAEPAALMTMPSEGEGRVIGIIDTGIDVAHPALAGAHITAQDFASYVGRRPLDHGTAVASILAGGGDGFRGLAPRAEIYAASVFFSPDGGGEIATTASLVRALDWMIDRGVHIVNMSLTGPQNAILQSAIDRAYERGVLVVAAVGNEGPAAGPLYPAAYKNVVGVTAVSRAKKIYRLANRGDYVDFAAPGVDIEHAAEGGGFAASSGTSMAAPFVAAVLAEECQSTTGEVGEACLAALMRNAEDLGPRGYDPIFGHGLIRAVAAMR